MTGALLGASMPNFWLALLLILLFAVRLGWLPVFGYGGLRHLVLPAVTLGTGLAAVTTRLTRSSMLEVLRQDYITTARAKGLGEGKIISRHALKNAFIPIVTVVGLQLGHLLEGTVIVESIFAGRAGKAFGGFHLCVRFCADSGLCAVVCRDFRAD
jgi:peptide/nickel transport system permease protein